MLALMVVTGGHRGNLTACRVTEHRQSEVDRRRQFMILTRLIRCPRTFGAWSAWRPASCLKFFVNYHQ